MHQGITIPIIFTSLFTCRYGKGLAFNNFDNKQFYN